MIAKANDLNVKVNVILAGTCAAATTAASSAMVSSNNATAQSATTASVIPAESYFSSIASQTGGSYTYLPGGTSAQYADSLGKIFDKARNGYENLGTNALVSGSAGERKYFMFEPPADATGMTLRVSDGTGQVSIYLSKGEFPGESFSDWSPTVNTGAGVRTINLNPIPTGKYYLMVKGINNFSNKRIAITYRYIIGGGGL